MAIIATRLSQRVEAGFSVVPGYKTNVKQLASGMEARNAVWARPRRRWTARYGAFTPEMRAELLGLVHVVRGQLDGFLFKDWSDYKALLEPLGNAPSGTTAVQLTRTYTFGSESVVRTIKRPVASTVVVYQNGTPKAGSVDAETGLFTPSSSWSAGQPLTWSGEFLCVVRLATDDVEFVLPHREIAEVNMDLIEVLE